MNEDRNVRLPKCYILRLLSATVTGPSRDAGTESPAVM